MQPPVQQCSATFFKKKTQLEEMKLETSDEKIVYGSCHPRSSHMHTHTLYLVLAHRIIAMIANSMREHRPCAGIAPPNRLQV